MRVSKFWDFLSIALVAVVFAACNNTVSSTDASKNDGLDFIPGFEPGKTHSKANDVSSSSQDQSSGSDESSSASEESSSSDGEEEESSSSEVEVDFSESEIQVDGSGVAVITDAYLTEV